MTALTQSLGTTSSAPERSPRRALARWSGDDGAASLAAELERLIAGDKGTWEAFVQRYARVIFAAVQRRLVPAGRAHEVDDVTQDVFVKICNRDFKLLRSYDPKRAKLSTWLTVIATSAAIDHLRRNSTPTSDIEALPEAALAVEPKLPEPIKIPPQLLSPRQALVMTLIYDKELEVADAARVMGVTPHTVRSMHHKALVKLRAHFGAELA